MICGGSSSCGCGFQSDSLIISNNAGLISIETFGPAIVAAKADVASPFTNQIVHETDTGLTWMWSGSTWQLYGWTVAPRCIMSETGFSVAHNDTSVEVSFTTQIYDPLGWHSSGDPTRFTPTIPGWYTFSIEAVNTTATADILRQYVRASRNGTDITTGGTDLQTATAADMFPRNINSKVEAEMNGTTDFFEVRPYILNDAATARTFTVRATLEWKANP